MWQSGFFEAGSHVVLGMTYRKAKIVGPDGVGRNYMMMKFEEVGRVPKDQVAIQRMAVSTCPSSQFYLLEWAIALHGRVLIPCLQMNFTYHDSNIMINLPIWEVISCLLFKYFLRVKSLLYLLVLLQ